MPKQTENPTYNQWPQKRVWTSNRLSPWNLRWRTQSFLSIWRNPQNLGLFWRIYCDMRSSGASTKIRRAENTAVRGPSGDVGLPLRADMATGSNQPWALSSTGLKFISYWDVSYMAEEACSWSLRFSAGLALQVAVKCVGVGYACVGAVVSWPQGPEPSRPKGAEPKWASARLSWLVITFWEHLVRGWMDIRNSLFLLFFGMILVWKPRGARVFEPPNGNILIFPAVGQRAFESGLTYLY